MEQVTFSMSQLTHPKASDNIMYCWFSMRIKYLNTMAQTKNPTYFHLENIY
jgi:hypothetical protein